MWLAGWVYFLLGWSIQSRIIWLGCPSKIFKILKFAENTLNKWPSWYGYSNTKNWYIYSSWWRLHKGRVFTSIFGPLYCSCDFHHVISSSFYIKSYHVSTGNDNYDVLCATLGSQEIDPVNECLSSPCHANATCTGTCTERSLLTVHFFIFDRVTRTQKWDTTVIKSNLADPINVSL